MLSASFPELTSREAIVGQDPALLAVVDRAARIAGARAAVLVMGESGTGKELLARLLHDLGPNAGGPFVAVNCGALSRELAESELFGHERGSFTGASGRRAGWFEEASGGTLVLDEVGELPLDLQPKLLRVLETGRLRRVGGSGETLVNVRVVALTLRNLRQEALRGSFRTDLYHRLSPFEFVLPPLRQRPADVATLSAHFLAEVMGEVGYRELTPLARQLLAEHDWPGNVRELRNVIRRAAFLCDGVIDAGDLELDVTGAAIARAQRAAECGDCDGSEPPDDAATAGEAATTGLSGDVLHLTGRRYHDLERDIYGWALKRNGGSRRRAAHALGISRSTFCDRVKRLGL
jgi:DNA-binding NtrC family response regulator